MKLASLEAIFRALDDSRVRYLVVGGVAVNVHGYQRLTHDVDLVVQLRPENVLAAFEALSSLGYSPSVPVTPEGFADPGQRQRWIEEKGMQVLALVSDQHRETPIDLFVVEPFDFDREHGRALIAELAPDLRVRFVSIPTLIEMKRSSGRPVDLDDVQHLRWILAEERGDGPT